MFLLYLSLTSSIMCPNYIEYDAATNKTQQFSFDIKKYDTLCFNIKKENYSVAFILNQQTHIEIGMAENAGGIKEGELTSANSTCGYFLNGSSKKMLIAMEAYKKETIIFSVASFRESDCRFFGVSTYPNENITFPSSSYCYANLGLSQKSVIVQKETSNVSFNDIVVDQTRQEFKNYGNFVLKKDYGKNNDTTITVVSTNIKDTFNIRYMNLSETTAFLVPPPEAKKAQKGINGWLIALFVYATINIGLFIAFVVLACMHPNRLYKIGCDSYWLYCCCPNYLPSIRLFYYDYEPRKCRPENMCCCCCFCCAPPLPPISRDSYNSKINTETQEKIAESSLIGAALVGTGTAAATSVNTECCSQCCGSSYYGSSVALGPFGKCDLDTACNDYDCVGKGQCCCSAYFEEAQCCDVGYYDRSKRHNPHSDACNCILMCHLYLSFIFFFAGLIALIVLICTLDDDEERRFEETRFMILPDRCFINDMNNNNSNKAKKKEKEEKRKDQNDFKPLEDQNNQSNIPLNPYITDDIPLNEIQNSPYNI